MATIAEQFVQPIINCQEAQNAGSCILLANLPDCKQEPDRITLNNTGTTPAAPVGTSMQLVFGGAVDEDGAVVATADLELTYKIRKDAVLHFYDPTVAESARVYATAKVTQEIEVSSDGIAAAVVEITANEDEIDATWVAELFADMCEITDATDIPLASDTTDDDRKVLKNGLQGSNVKTNISASIALQMITNPENKAQFSVLFRASQSSEDIYVAAVKSSGYALFGRAKVMSYNIAGAINSIERVSTTINFQAPFAFAFLNLDPTCNPSVEDRAALAAFGRLAGLPELLGA